MCPARKHRIAPVNCAIPLPWANAEEQLRVFVEHSIQDRTDDERVAIADGAFDEVVRRLLGRED